MTMTERPRLESHTEAVHVTNYTVVVDYAPRCTKCNRVIAVIATRPWQIQCSRQECRTMHYSKSVTV